jgi:hypothetical protein
MHPAEFSSTRTISTGRRHRPGREGLQRNARGRIVAGYQAGLKAFEGGGGQPFSTTREDMSVRIDLRW